MNVKCPQCGKFALSTKASENEPSKLIACPSCNEKLARKFSQLLCEEIGRFKVCRVNKRNYNALIRNSKTKVCHSHDFCDANEVMLQACKNLGIIIEFEDDDDPARIMFNEAWTLAKANQFYLAETVQCPKQK